MAKLNVGLTPVPKDVLNDVITITPQQIPVTDNQVQNEAGGYVYKISPIERLKRFLILGTESSTYYQSQTDVQVENLVNVLTCIREYPEETIKIVVASSANGTALKPAYPIAVLALMWHYGDRKKVSDNAFAVIRTLSHLMLFLKYLKDINGGKLKTSRSLRRFINTFFTKRDLDWVAYQTLKYRNRSGWSVTDIMRISHPEPDTPELENYFAWLFQINNAQPRVRVDETRLPQVARDFSTLSEYGLKCRKTGTVDESTVDNVINVIRNNRHITWEMIPNEFMVNEQVWLELVNHIPYTALLRNVSRIIRSFDYTKFADTLTHRLDNEESIVRARVNPMQLFVATETILSTIAAVTSRNKIQNIHTPEDYFDTFTKSLSSAFRKSFRATPTSDKKLFIAIDISGSMYATYNGSIRYIDIAFVLATILKHYFPQSIVYLFSAAGVPGRFRAYNNGLKHITTKEAVLKYRTFVKDLFQTNSGLVGIDIDPDQINDLTSIRRLMQTIPPDKQNATDCALPFLYAYANDIFDIDGFLTITDNATWAGIIHPFEALKAYRTVKDDAKSVVLALTSTAFSIADPNDPYSIDIAGFSPEITTLIAKFVDTTLNISFDEE